jgi:hypothetical protein
MTLSSKRAIYLGASDGSDFSSLSSIELSAMPIMLLEDAGLAGMEHRKGDP